MELCSPLKARNGSPFFGKNGFSKSKLLRWLIGFCNKSAITNKKLIPERYMNFYKKVNLKEREN